MLLPDAPTFFELLGMTKTGRGTLDVLRREGLFAAVSHYFSGKLWLLIPLLPALGIVFLTYLGCGLQLVVWLWRRQWYLAWLFMGFVAYFLVLPGPIVMPRYHLPALPMMCVMAALCLVAVWRRWRPQAG